MEKATAFRSSCSRALLSWKRRWCCFSCTCSAVTEAQSHLVLTPMGRGAYLHARVGCTFIACLVQSRAAQWKLIKILCWAKNWILCEYPCFGLSPNIFLFPQQVREDSWNRQTFCTQETVFLSFEGITCLLLHLHKGSLFFPIYSKLHSCMWTLCSHFPPNTKQNYLHCHSSLSFFPHYKELMQIYFCLVWFMLTAINSKASA